jgi:hypothetical protein
MLFISINLPFGGCKPARAFAWLEKERQSVKSWDPVPAAPPFQEKTEGWLEDTLANCLTLGQARAVPNAGKLVPKRISPLVAIA